MDETGQKIEDKILEILSKEILSISELSRRLNVKRYILAGYLEALREQGKVDVFKVGKAKVYVAKEKLKKGLWMIFFLTFIPFLLSTPSFAQISVNFTPSNKIWIINSNGNLFYTPSIIIVTANCNITFAYLYDSFGTEYIIGTNKISGNQISLKTTTLNMDLLAQGANYSLNLSCDNASESFLLNVSYIEASASIVDAITRSSDLFEDSALLAILTLKENGRFLNPVEEQTNLNITLFVDRVERNVSIKYYPDSNEIEISFDSLPSGTHNVSILISYNGLPSPIQLFKQIDVKKRLSIKSISPQFLTSNISATITLDTSIQLSDISSLKIFVDDVQASLISASGNTITILTPSLSPGEHVLTVRYGKYADSIKVYYTARIAGKIVDELNKPIFARFTFFKNGSPILSTTTNSSGNYEIALPPAYYDLKIEFSQATLYFKNFYFRETDGLIHYIYKDSVQVKGLKVYGFYLFEFSGDYSSVDLELKYSKMNVEDEDKMKVFYCDSWNFAANSCNSNWKTLDFVLDKINSKVTLNLNHLSVFVIGREVSLRVACSINKNSFYINETATISCLVEDEDGNVIENASVTLNFGEKTVRGKTNRNGIFTYEYLVDGEGDFNVSVSAHKNPYLSASTYVAFSAERKKELFISFPDLIKAEIGSNTTIEFSILNTGQADLNNLQIYLEDLPFAYVLSQNYLSKMLAGERKNFTLAILIPANSSAATYSSKIKVVSEGLESTKNFGLTLIKSEKPQPQSAFMVKLPQINLHSTYSYLIIFAAISFSLAFVLKKMKKKREKRISYDDVFSKLEVR